MTQPNLPGERGLQDASFLVNQLTGHYSLLLAKLLREHDLADEIGPGMGPVLFALFDRESVRLRELSEITRLAPSTITELVQRMEKRGLVARERDPDDGRARQIRLTPAATALRDRCVSLSRELNQTIADPFTPGEFELLTSLWSRLNARLAAAHGQTRQKSGKP